ncbi:MAG TPA: sugar phosphate nucleotidyltransferase [Candidatus Saccharimonadales bacterium]
MNNVSNKPITKAVIAAAGFGTRFLPQTKAMPKEMLPLVDKPIIQYVVEELVAVGVKDIIIVTGYSKRSIEDHFDRPSEDLLANLRAGGPKKAHLLKQVESIADLANFVYVRQKGPYGNATPLINVEHLVNNEPFFYTYSDDFFSANPLRFDQMLQAYHKFKCPILSTVKVSKPKDYDGYGFAGGTKIDDKYIDVDAIVEKPGYGNAPSDQATVSGFILTPDIYKYIHEFEKLLEPGKEFYANDALKLMINDNKRVIACEIQNAQFFDAGDKLGYLKAVFDFAIKDPDLGPALKEYLTKKL